MGHSTASAYKPLSMRSGVMVKVVARDADADADGDADRAVLLLTELLPTCDRTDRLRARICLNSELAVVLAVVVVAVVAATAAGVDVAVVGCACTAATVDGA